MPSFSDSPQKSSTDAAVFWSPERCPHVLPVTAVAASRGRSAPSLDLSRLPCRVCLLELPSGARHLLLRDGARSLQLAVAGADVLQPVYLCVDALVEPERLQAHLHALQCLNALNASRRFPARLFPPEPRGERLALVLQALDGWIDQTPYREIATALFGSARTAADWSDPGGHLRDRTRRAVRRGRALTDGGYRQFLL